MFMEKNRQIHRELCLFPVNLGDPADLECHDIVLKGIVCFFSLENAYVTADIFRKSLQTGIKLIFCILFFCS